MISLCLLFLAACGERVSLDESSEPPATSEELPTVEESKVVGMWNDGRVGENSGLYFAADGTGDRVSLVCAPIQWRIDSTNVVVTIQGLDGVFRPWSDGVRYDPDRDVLIVSNPRTISGEWVFERQPETAVESWLKTKRDNAREMAEKLSGNVAGARP